MSSELFTCSDINTIRVSTLKVDTISPKTSWSSEELAGNHVTNNWGLSAYFTAGSGTFYAPRGCERVKVQMWGGGGCGGRRSSNRAHGGARGAYGVAIIALTGTGHHLSLNIGAGGDPSGVGNDADGLEGGTTVVINNANSEVYFVSGGVGGDAFSGAGNGSMSTRGGSSNNVFNFITQLGSPTNGWDDGGGEGGSAPYGGSGGLNTASSNSESSTDTTVRAGQIPGGGGAASYQATPGVGAIGGVIIEF